ncbi:MAG: mevalonate kinase [Desulfobacteraceae bacterium]|nr:mevalonate kinase [Desulfobacteraceae bacterium]
MGKGSAFGKTILIGDAFVLREVPAIVSSIPFETECTVQRLNEGQSWILEDNRTEVPGYKQKKKDQQVDSINRILEVMNVNAQKNPIKITYGGSLLAGSGVGASAASCVSLARALNDEFNLNLSIEEINHIGWEGEFAYHGIPSGVDNTASTYGGLILYRIQNEQTNWEHINLKEPVEVVLGNSGVTADTSKLDAHVKAQQEKEPDLFNQRLQAVSNQAFEMKKALENHDLEKVGQLMTANHKILIEMDLSHEKLIYLCNLAIELGALGAKVTGGGRGGYMSSLTPGKELQEKVAKTFEEEGYKVIRATIGGS